MVSSQLIIHRNDKVEYSKFLKNIDAKNVSFKDIVEGQYNKKEKIWVLRHDICTKNELNKALLIAKAEQMNGIKSTYFLLPESEYFDYSKELIYCCKYFEELGHSVGLHNNAVTSWFKAKKSKSIKKILYEPLDFLRKNNIEIIGTSTCETNKIVGYKYFNYEIWEELNEKKNEIFKRDVFDLPKISLKELGLKYEAFFIDYVIYLSDFTGNWCGYATSKNRPKLTDMSILFSNKNIGKSAIGRFNSFVGGGLFHLSISVSRNWWFLI